MKASVPVVDQLGSSASDLLKRSGYPRYELAVRQDLLERVTALSYRGFEECIKHLLNRLGYEQVRHTGRTAWRGRTRHGGRELEAIAATSVTRSHVLIQLKQYSRPVSRRFVDELRGTMCRRHATHGIIISTSEFPGPARFAAQGDRRMTIDLMDGAGLLDALFTTQLGIRKMSSRRWRIEEGYFLYLNQQFPRSLRRRSTRAHKKNDRQLGTRAKATRDGKNSDELEGGPVTWRTHVLAGTSAVWLLGLIPDALTLDTLGISLLAAAFGALLPDLDASRAKITTLGIGGIRPFVPMSEVIYRTWGHRGPLHSYVGLIGAAGGAIIFGRALSWEIGLAFLLGYASHLAADACTKSGIPLFSASSRGPRFHLLPSPLRFRTGSQAEDMLLPFLAVATALLVFTHLPH